MITHFSDLPKTDAPLANGKGNVYGVQLLSLEDFQEKGRLFKHCTLKPGCSVGTHTHKGDFEVYYILKGEGLYDDNGTMTTVKPGDVTLCQAGETHMLENQGSEDLEFIALVLFTK